MLLPLVYRPEISVDANGMNGRDHGPTAGGRTVTDGVGDGATDADTDALSENDTVTDADTVDDTEALREAVGDTDVVGVAETVAAAIERTAWEDGGGKGAEKRGEWREEQKRKIARSDRK